MHGNFLYLKRYNGKMVSNQFKLIEPWNYELFADEAIYMLKRFITQYISKDKFKESLKAIYSWNTRGTTDLRLDRSIKKF